MKKDTALLKECLQELERVNWIFPGLPQKSLIDRANDCLSQALVPKLKDIFIKPGDLCDLCRDFATDRRTTHWSNHKLCDQCAEAYDLASGDTKKFRDGLAIEDKGSDPFGIV